MTGGSQNDGVRVSNATILVYIPHLWVEIAQRRQRNLMMHDVIRDERERGQTKNPF